MSMYRQLWLSIFVSMLIALGASLFASLINARSYLEDQLAIKNHDNAVALALSVSQSHPDPKDVILAATALFNSGHYDYIQVVDPNGKSIVEKAALAGDLGAPGWFVRWLPIRPVPGQAEITNGWKPVGTVTLMSASRFAYRALWQTAIYMTGAILFAGLLGGVLGSLVLSRIRRPMQSVIDQARAITEHRFVAIPEPDVPELRQLAAAMNDTVHRLRQIFEDDAARYETLRREANYDPLTGLANRSFFMASLEAALEAEEMPFGSLALIRVANLDRINRLLGRAVADDLLRRIGGTLNEVGESRTGILPARPGGSDFALLMPAECDVHQTLEWLMDELSRRTEPIVGKEPVVYVGYGGFVPGDDPAALLARVDAALAVAVSSGVNSIQEAGPERERARPLNAEEWRSAIRRVLDGTEGLRLERFPIRSLSGGAAMHESALRLRIEPGGEWLTASRFLPVAERLGLVQELDLTALGLALEELVTQPGLAGLWVHLSPFSMEDGAFHHGLLDLLADYTEAAGRLWVEVPETGALRRIDSLRTLVGELKPLGCHVGLAHYGYHFNLVGMLYDLGLDFLKVDASFVHGIEANPGNQAFLAGLCDISHKIGMRVYAEGVEGEAELDKLRELGFDGATGLAIREA